MTLVQTSQGTYAMGGQDVNGNARNKVFQLDCPGDQISSCQWKEMEQKLEFGRYGHVSIPLPESYDICHKGSYGSKIEGAISDYWNYLTDIYNDFKTKATKKEDMGTGILILMCTGIVLWFFGLHMKHLDSKYQVEEKAREYKEQAEKVQRELEALIAENQAKERKNTNLQNKLELLEVVKTRLTCKCNFE